MDPIARLARVPRRPTRSDLVLAGALCLWALLDAVFGSGPGSVPVRILFALVVTVPLIWRRRAPLAVVAIISVALLARAFTAELAESGTTPFPSLLVATFSVAVYAPTIAGAVAGGLVLAGTMAVAISSSYYSGSPNVGNYAILFFFFGGAWVSGWLVRRHAAQVRSALAESGELAREAVAEERARIARELHDVVAHSVSIVAVQAGAAEELIDHDPEAAREHMHAVRRTAREAMVEMRRLLQVLREDEPRYVPQPGLSRLGDLLAETRGAGVPVELVEEGTRPDLPAGIDLVLFRIVQESLTNVRKHAGAAPTRVSVRYGDREIALDIDNEPGAQAAARNGSRRDASDRGGHGLVGMRERALLFGGRFEAGERDGGFHVGAVLPLQEVA